MTCQQMQKELSLCEEKIAYYEREADRWRKLLGDSPTQSTLKLRQWFELCDPVTEAIQ